MVGRKGSEREREKSGVRVRRGAEVVKEKEGTRDTAT